MATDVEPRSNRTYSDYHALRTVEDVTERNVQAILQLEQAAKACRCNADRIADLIARAKRITWNTVHRWLGRAAGWCRRFSD